MVDKNIRVVIVDDAEFMRKELTRLLESDENIKVVGYGKTGQEGIEAVKTLKPDVVTLDIDMPEMDGITALKHIMIECPTPVVVVSALTHQGDVTFESLRLGVVDFLPKPSGSVSRNIESQKEELIHRIKIASTVDVENIRRVKIQELSDRPQVENAPWTKKRIIVVGTSLGGPNHIIRLVHHLPRDFKTPILISQDISPMILESFVEKFNTVSPLNVVVAADKTILRQSTVYVNSLSNNIGIHEDIFEDTFYIESRPTEGKPIDAMMISAAEIFESGTIGMLIAGVNQDGVKGIEEVYRRGGTTLVQSYETHFLPDSDRDVLERGLITQVINDFHDIPILKNDL
ncbi:MAG: response regulator [Deltaproteobacteria bacterium]|nr:response regulator [Candidatus Zymogenaceae bacterium]